MLKYREGVEPPVAAAAADHSWAAHPLVVNGRPPPTPTMAKLSPLGSVAEQLGYEMSNPPDADVYGLLAAAHEEPCTNVHAASTAAAGTLTARIHRRPNSVA